MRIDEFSKISDNSCINFYCAILRQAIKDLKIKKQAELVRRWINRYDQYDPCSFNNICLAIGINYNDALLRFKERRVEPRMLSDCEHND